MFISMEYLSTPVYIIVLGVAVLLGCYAIFRYKEWRWLCIPTVLFCASALANRLIQSSENFIGLQESFETGVVILGAASLVYFFVGTYLFIKRKKRETQTQHDKERTTNKKK